MSKGFARGVAPDNLVFLPFGVKREPAEPVAGDFDEGGLLRGSEGE